MRPISTTSPVTTKTSRAGPCDWRTTNLGLGFLAHKRFGADLFLGFYGTQEPTDDYGGFDVGVSATMRL